MVSLSVRDAFDVFMSGSGKVGDFQLRSHSSVPTPCIPISKYLSPTGVYLTLLCLVYGLLWHLSLQDVLQI